MPDHTPSAVTVVLQDLHRGDPDAKARLLTVVYDELREIAKSFLRGDRSDQTLQPSDVVHEFVLRLLGHSLRAQNRQKFFAFATQTIRHIVAQYYRERSAQRRGRGWHRVLLDEVTDTFEERNLDVVAVNEILELLARYDQRQCEAFTLHVYWGFQVREIAAMLKVSESTVEKDLKHAKAWLRTQLAGAQP
jgi:RNA polymerase sigma factor (TIGR02999 family)